MSVQYYEGIGRRKESTARVRLMGGSGKFTVNEKEAAAYFTRLGDMEDVLRAFSAVGQD
ncbi:MAG: 30S ribosomal protein S9, partial [Chloroflexi bacterium RBG_16_56_8]